VAAHPHEPKPVSSAAVNAYLHGLVGLPASAKAFRTWSGTVVAAASRAGAVLPGLTTRTPPTSPRAAVLSAATLLGNTPSVARTSYVHPAVLAGDPDPGVQRAVDAAAADRNGHRDLRVVWIDPGVQAAVTHQLEELNAPPRHRPV
jgi:DNA topoisomerase-1